MSNTRRIKKKIEKKYKRPIDNLYSYRFYTDMFSGYAYSLSEDKTGRRDFYKISSDDKEIVKLFRNSAHYDFSYEFGQTIDSVLYSMAVYGKAYIFIKPEYIEKTDEKEKIIKIISALHIGEVKGIPKKNTFYYSNFSKEISEFNLCEGSLITFDLKEVGYKRKYFVKLVKQLGKYDATSSSLELINNEPSYDFNVHITKSRKQFLRKVRNIGWNFGNDGLSDSYILYKQIQMKLFKMKMLQYVLGKINLVLADVYIINSEFKIEALPGNIDYEDAWAKFQNGKFTVSELSNIIWKGSNV